MSTVRKSISSKLNESPKSTTTTAEDEICSSPPTPPPPPTSPKLIIKCGEETESKVVDITITNTSPSITPTLSAAENDDDDVVFDTAVSPATSPPATTTPPTTTTTVEEKSSDFVELIVDTTSTVPIKEQPPISPANSTDLITDSKRSKLKNSVAPLSPTCSQPQQQQPQQAVVKKMSVGDDLDETVSLTSSCGAGGGESISELSEIEKKAVTVVPQSSSTTANEETTNKSESPARGRKKKVFDKTAIITRKSALESAAKPPEQPVATPNVRSMRNRRNSTGKIDIKQTNTEPKKRTTSRKTLSATPEPRTPNKRKREDSQKTDDHDDQQPNDKIVKYDGDEEHDDDNMTIRTESDVKLDIEMKGEEIDDDLKKDSIGIADEDEEKLESIDDIRNEIIDDEMIEILPSDSSQTTGITKDSLADDHLDESKCELNDDLLDVKDKETKSDDESNETAKYAAYQRPRRGRPKNQVPVKETTPQRRRRSDKIPIDTPAELPGIKRPRRQGRKIGGPVKKETAVDADDSKTELDECEIKPATTGSTSECSNSLEEPLTVDTTTPSLTATEIEKSLNEPNCGTSTEDQATNSDKAASLSPEMVSEGVSVISVKQFYKKPEFLANNLGIEKDPKLGEIVQEVEKSNESPAKKEAASDTKCPIKEINDSNNEIVLDGILHAEDESDPETESNKIKNEINKNDVDSDDVKSEQSDAKDHSKNDLEEMEIKKLCDNDKNRTETGTTAVENECKIRIIESKDNNKPPPPIECLKKEESICERIEKDLRNNLSMLNESCIDEDDDDDDDNNSEKLEIDENSRESDTDENDEQLKSIEIDSGVSDVTENHLKGTKTNVPIMKSMKLTKKTKQSDNNCKLNNKIVLNDDDDEEMMEIDVNDEMNRSKQELTDEERDSSTSSNETTENDKNSSSAQENLLETPETMRRKEKHFKNLGLLTHKAAKQAHIDKQRRSKHVTVVANSVSSSVAGSSNSQAANLLKTASETGTNSPVYSIKLNRQTANNSNTENKRKSTPGGNSTGNNGGRQSLKITFQKGRGRGLHNERGGNQSNQSGEETYYTIQNENESGPPVEAVQHGRKYLIRYHLIDNTANQSDATDITNKKDGKQKILIPEKASSFSIHPGRLCQDQCYYCGGKFGLYDTPCHVAQLKSAERQQKILENEEKLTVDNCLCDACFRHVDKRANVPSYKKRLSASSARDNDSANNSLIQNDNGDDQQQEQQHHLLHQQQPHAGNPNFGSQNFGNRSVCFVPECNNASAHSLRKKCIRKTIKKILPNFDMSTIGGVTPICSQHYDSILQYLGCALCKRRLGKNHMYHIPESEKLEVLLSENNVPVQVGNSSAICKLCRYFTNLLMKPSTGAKQNEFVRSYRRRLLQFHNVQTDEEGSDDLDVSDKTKGQKRGRKSKKHLSESKNCDSNSPPALVAIDSNSLVNAATSGQMMLDNDVLVDYDVPMISDSPSPSPPPLLASKLKSILQGGDKSCELTLNKKEDISLVLRSNPNISMRELFQGEEEMGLTVNLPFGSSGSQRTPEGWTRVQTFLQYDEPTRRLWEELQKPYGNQSSFLKHLILLEKYFRNGDLMLSNNASTNAAIYSETVQNRLRSYDNTNQIASTLIIPDTAASSPSSNTNQSDVSCRIRSRSTSTENTKQIHSNYPITITSRPKQANNNNNTSNTTTNNSAILSTNTVAGCSTDNSVKSNSSSKNAIEILPISSKNNNDNNLSPGSMTKQQKLLAAANKLIGNETATDSPNKNSSDDNTASNKLKIDNCVNLSTASPSPSTSTSMPPNLISINHRPGNSSVIKQRDQQMQQLQLQHQQQLQRIQNFPQHQQNKPGTSRPQIIVLPETLTTVERMNSKNWRPTLMPVAATAHINQTGLLYQTADGRKLPALVQVQSGGRPYLISIQDYNRMCILRREKLLREQMLKGTKHNKHSNNNNLLRQQTQLSSHQQQQHQQQQNKIQIPNKILEQNSLIPVGSNQNRPGTSAIAAQQQIQQNIKKYEQMKRHQASLLKTHVPGNFVPILPKPQQNHQLQILATSSGGGGSGSSTSMNLTPSLVKNSISIVPSIASVVSLAPIPSTTAHTSSSSSVTPTLISTGPGNSNLNNSTPWQWNNGNPTHKHLALALNPGLSMKPIMTQQQQQQQRRQQQIQQLFSQHYMKTSVTSNHIGGGNNNNNSNNSNNNNNNSNCTSTITSSPVILDNSLLKIPKSLTVIPQQKILHGRPTTDDTTNSA